MKIRLEVDTGIEEEEVLIRCRSQSEEVKKVLETLTEILSKQTKFIFYKQEREYYFSLDNVLFFETDGTGVCAHTRKDMYQVKFRLYELEEILPTNFLRVSKSSILNIKQIYSIDRNITSSSSVKFQNTYKQVYVSRKYYKILKNKLIEMR